MANSLFGVEVDYAKLLKDSIRILKDVPNPVYGRLLMDEIYETVYGIHDHIKDKSPLASVSFHEKEKYLDRFLYEGYLTTFIYRDIGRRLNMSFDEFINRPRYEIEMMVKIINERDRLNQQVMKEVDAKSVQKELSDLTN